MKEVDRAICLELEKALMEDEDKSFVEVLYELGIIDPDLDMNESSENTYLRVKAKSENVIPRTAGECLNVLEDLCQDINRIYQSGEFCEDSRDKFLGGSVLADRILDVICKYKTYQKMIEDEKRGDFQ